MKKKYKLSIIFFSCLYLITTNSNAQLNFSNPCGAKFRVIIKYLDPKTNTWTVKGWSTIYGFTKQQLLNSSEITNRYVYFYAESENGAILSGDVGTCVPIEYTYSKWKDDESPCREGTVWIGLKLLDLHNKKRFDYELCKGSPL